MAKRSLYALCSELEARGLIVIRAREHGSPDLIAIPAAQAEHIQAVSVVLGDEATSQQTATLETLRAQGLQVSFHYPEAGASPNRTHVEVMAFEAECYKQGFIDSGSGQRADNPYKRRSASWYRFRANYERGWNDGVELFHKLVKHAHPSDAPVTPPAPEEGE